MHSWTNQYWGTDDSIQEATLTMTLKKPERLYAIRIREPIKLGQRIESFTVEALNASDEWQIVAEGTVALRIEAWAEPMFAAAIVCNGVFVGAGDTLKPALMSLTSMWGVRLTLAWWLSQTHGLRGVWTAMAIELTFRGAIFLARLLHGGWNRKSLVKPATGV